jgi:hypothetical protein
MGTVAFVVHNARAVRRHVILDLQHHDPEFVAIPRVAFAFAGGGAG